MRRFLLTVSRRAALGTLLGTALMFTLPEVTHAADALDFTPPMRSFTGPFKDIGERLARKTRGRVGAGGEAQLLLEDYLERGDTHAPVEIHRLANSGDAKARTVLGYMFDNGIGARKNERKAFENFMLAANKEDLARYNMGVMMRHGRGTTANVSKAMEHFMQTKRIPWVYVPMTLHAMEQGQGAVALELAEQAHKAKDSYGSYLYARLLLENGDNDAGAKVMKEAASAGVPEAIQSMIYLFEHGIGVGVDNAMAIGWWIIDQVLNRGSTFEQAEKAAESFDINKGIRSSGVSFARKMLINRQPWVPFDYSATLTYSELNRGR